MRTIQRPNDAMGSPLWAAPDGPFPINSQLVVGQEECLVAALDGVIVGVVPAGTYWLHPQPLPFLASSISGSNIRAELWFVRMSATPANRFGGSVDVIDSGLGLLCTARVMGEYSLKVNDPKLLVTASLGQGSSAGDALFGWASGVVTRHVLQVFASLAADQGVKLLEIETLLPRLTEEASRGMSELQSSGLALGHLGSLAIAFSEEDRERLRSATAADDAEKRAKTAAAQAVPAAIRCTQCGAPNDRGRFCTACGHSCKDP